MAGINWYQGTLKEATDRTAELNALLIVYIEGNDSCSKKITNWLECEKVALRLNNNKFVCVRIFAGSSPYMEFVHLYHLVPVPSIFILTSNGIPVEIITSIVPTLDELENKIDNIIKKYDKLQNDLDINSNCESAGFTEPSPGCNDNNLIETISESRLIAGADEVIKNDSIVMHADSSKLEQDLKEMSTSKGLAKLPVDLNSTDLVVSKSKSDTNNELMSKKAMSEENEEPKAKEKKDIMYESNSITVTSKKTDSFVVDDERQAIEEHNKKILSEIKRARMEEREARDYIKAQIAADKLERARKFAEIEQELIGNSNNQQQHVNRIHHTNNNEVSLQFRFGNGETLTHTFESNTKLSEINQYVRDTILKNSMDFKLATTHPKHEFTIEEINSSLAELNLTPTAVLVIIPKKQQMIPYFIAESLFMNTLNGFLWSVINPIIGSVIWIKNWLINRNPTVGRSYNSLNVHSNKEQSGNDVSRSETTANRRNIENSESSAYLRYATGSNVHQLSDIDRNSDNDENATWNGNSTQQQ